MKSDYKDADFEDSVFEGPAEAVDVSNVGSKERGDEGVAGESRHVSADEECESEVAAEEHNKVDEEGVHPGVVKFKWVDGYDRDESQADGDHADHQGSLHVDQQSQEEHGSKDATKVVFEPVEKVVE